MTRRPAPAPAAEDDGSGYLVSVSDMMAGLLFIFLITLVAFVINFRIATEEQRAAEEDALGQKEQAIAERERAEQERDAARTEKERAEQERDAARTERERAEQERDAAQTERERAEQEHDAARTEKERLEVVRDDLTNAKRLRQQMLEDIRVRLEARGIRVEIDHDHGVLRLSENAISFRSSRADLLAEDRRRLAQIGAVLMEVLPCHAMDGDAQCDDRKRGKLEAVFIEGHTDNVPLQGGRFDDNWDLSAQRAMYTYRLLAGREPGLAGLRNRLGQPLFSVSGYGEGRPVIGHERPTPEPRNRRIDLRFIMAPPPAARDPEPIRALRERGVR